MPTLSEQNLTNQAVTHINHNDMALWSMAAPIPSSEILPMLTEDWIKLIFEMVTWYSYTFKLVRLSDNIHVKCTCYFSKMCYQSCVHRTLVLASYNSFHLPLCKMFIAHRTTIIQWAEKGAAMGISDRISFEI